MTSGSARKPPSLTALEAETVAILRRGVTQKAAAAELRISERAVEERLSRARRRFGVATTSLLLTRVRARPRPTLSSHTVESHIFREN